MVSGDERTGAKLVQSLPFASHKIFKYQQNKKITSSGNICSRIQHAYKSYSIYLATFSQNTRRWDGRIAYRIEYKRGQSTCSRGKMSTAKREFIVATNWKKD